MDDLLKKVTNLGFGALYASREKLEQKVKEWTDSEHLSPAEAKRVMHQLIEQGEEQRTEFVHMVQDQVQKTLLKFGIISPDRNMTAESNEYVRSLEERIAQLEQSLNGSTPNEERLPE